MRIGEGRKDDAPGIYEREMLGSCRPGSLRLELAIDPIDGTTLLSQREKGSISVAAFAWQDGSKPYASPLMPSFAVHYAQKLAVGPAVKEFALDDFNAPLSDLLSAVAGCLGKDVRDLVVAIRSAHATHVKSKNCSGQVALYGDFRTATSLLPSRPAFPKGGVDLFLATGGTPEAILSAAAIRCLGGQLLCRLSNHGLSNPVIADFDKVFTARDLVQGRNVLFVAVGITDSPLLRGIRVIDEFWETQSLVICSCPPHVRRVVSFHSYRTDEMLASRRRRA